MCAHARDAVPHVMTDFTPRYIIPKSNKITPVEDVDWGKKDPFADREIIKCPECEGKREIEMESGIVVICPGCKGASIIVRRTTD